MALVRTGWGEDVYSGHLFVFVSRRGARVKVLTFGRGGFILYYKRLETGRFRLPPVDEQAQVVPLDATQLARRRGGPRNLSRRDRNPALPAHRLQPLVPVTIGRREHDAVPYHSSGSARLKALL